MPTKKSWSRQLRDRPVMAPSIKESFKLASHAFIRRDNAQSLALVDEVFALLPAAPHQAWGVELAPKSRAQERWRNQAAALFVTVSTVDYKSRRPSPTGDASGTVETEDELIDRLSGRLHALYRSDPPQPQQPPIPPNLVATLAMSAKSLGLPSSTTRRMIESYLASGLPAELIDAIATGPGSSPEQVEGRPWWLKEASEGYEGLMELYLVDVLAGGNEAGEGEREEAKRLLDWDGVLGADAKQRIRTRLDAPAPSTPPVHPTALPPAIDSTLSDLPLSPPRSPSPTSAPPSARSETNPSSVLTPSPTVSSPSTPLPIVTPSPVPPPTPSSRTLAVARNVLLTHQNALTTTVPPLLAFVALLVLRRRNSRLLELRVWRKWVLWFLRTAWRDIRWTYALATSITYV